MSRYQDSPAAPVERLRALLCGCLLVALLTGCQQWIANLPRENPAFDALCCRLSPGSWEDAYRIESPDVLRVAIVEGEPAFDNIEGTYPVRPDGTIDLGGHDTIQVGGKRLTKAAGKIEDCVFAKRNRGKIAVTVEEHNSPYYYIVADHRGGRTAARRVALEQGTTAFDAIAEVEGFVQLCSNGVWIERWTGGGRDEHQILPVDVAAITQKGETGTNYMLMPGDVMYMGEDESCGPDSWPNRVSDPEPKYLFSDAVEKLKSLGSRPASRRADSSL